MGLLDSVAGALAQGQGQGQGGLGGALRGLGGLLGGNGGGTSAALISAVLAMLARNAGSSGGGLAALVDKFQHGGLGDVVGSWVGTGQNLPVSPAQVKEVFGADVLGQLADQVGMSTDEASSQLSQWLPHTVDQLTPDGVLPAEGEGGLGDIGAILERFAQR